MPSRRWLPWAVIGAGYLLGAVALYVGLPGQIPPSWQVSGGGLIRIGGPMAALLLPTASAITHRLLRGLCARSSAAESDASDILAVYDAILLR